MNISTKIVVKTKLICLLLPVVLLGCSKKQTPPPPPASSAAGGSLPQITVVKSPEMAEQNDIKKQALALLTAKDYDRLDALAARYRASRESYANGLWKLALFYSGLELSNRDPETLWQEREQQIRDWIKAKPASVTARVELGRFLRDYAWKARGGGWASTVSDEGWKLMGERLQTAAQVLAEAGKLDEKCPVYWSAVQRVALGMQLDRSRYDDLCDAATKAFPDYEWYYNNRAMFLMPRWYGETGEVERDLEKSANKIGGERGDMLYAQVVWGVHYSGSTTNVMIENNFSWPRTERGFDAILKKFPDSLAAQNEAAHLAALVGEQRAALKYFNLTKGRVDVSLWDSKDQYVDCYKWALGQ